MNNTAHHPNKTTASNISELHAQVCQEIHVRALEISARYKRSEFELIEVLDQVETRKVHLRLGRSSLFHYGVHDLKLSTNTLYNLITVMRKAREIPQLKTEIRDGRITLSNARRIAPLLTSENQCEWLEKAGTLSQRQLEKEIVKVRPESAVREHASYVTSNRVKLEVGLQEKDMIRLRRVQDLVSQSRSRNATLEDTLNEMAEFYLKHHDPLLKAKRAMVKKGLKNTEVSEKISAERTCPPVNHSDAEQHELASRRVRTPIPANILHQVNLRDQRRCTFVNHLDERCNQTRWTEIHHTVPVAHGGKNTVENLVTLCSVHHRWIHADGGSEEQPH